MHSGQHYEFDMSGVFFEQLGIPQPDTHLEVGAGSHGAQTGKIMTAFEDHLLGLPTAPGGVVVGGDVNSTMACALVAVNGDDVEVAWRAIADAIAGEGRAPRPIDGWDGHAAERVVAALDAAWPG